MSLLDILIEYKWVIIFYSSILLIIYLNKKRFEKQASFIYLYKTKVGLKLMDTLSEKFRKPIKIWGYIGVFLAYLGFFFISYAIVKNAYELIINKPGVMGGSPVIPGLPIAGLGIKFPLVIGWISLFIIIIFHEFAHGVVARAHNVKVKSSGIAFFGPLLGAFVEPDEKQLIKQPHRVQHSIYAAGPVANVVLWVLCLILMLGVVKAITFITDSNGVNVTAIPNSTLPAYIASLPNNTVISKINGKSTTTLGQLETALKEISPGKEAIIETKSKKTYNLTAVSHPNDAKRAYLGIYIIGEDRVLKENTLLLGLTKKSLEWLFDLLWWTHFISLAIGLINLFPVFITDGARMLKINFEYLFRSNKEKGLKIWQNINLAALFVMIILLFLPLVRSIFQAFIGFF